MNDTDALPDWIIVAKTLAGEAESDGYAGMQAVGSVIQRRVLLRWQREETARGVCLHPYQFSCWLPGADRDRIMAAEYTTPQDALVIADMVMKQILPDNTQGADSYEVTGTGANWEKGLQPCAVIGKQSFYKTRRT